MKILTKLWSLVRRSATFTDYAPCDGRLLSITEHPDLFAVVGHRYGAARPGMFKVPDMRRVARFHPPHKRSTYEIKLTEPRAGALRVKTGNVVGVFWDAPLDGETT